MNLKCLFGFHDWKPTGIMRMYGFIRHVKCSRCGKTTEVMTYPNTRFEFIGDQECLIIRAGKP